MSTATALLRVEGVHAGYGRVEALHDVGIAVAEGEAVALIGANGAGKTTMMRAVIGLVQPRRGTIHFGGVDVTRITPEKRARLGMGYCPEGRRIFAGMTVRENLEVASYEAAGSRRSRMDEVMDVFPVLRERHDALGWQLSGGQQQMLAIGRALMTRPRLLLLDEPSLGLSPKLVTEVLAQVRRVVEGGTAVLLAEQNVAKALRYCHRAYVIRVGRVVRSGRVEELRDDDSVREAYLGG